MSFAMKLCALLVSLAAIFSFQDERPAVLAHSVDVAHPPAAYVAVNKLLRAAKSIRADFAEEKKIKVLKRPLRSSGQIVFSGKLGLYRALKDPFVQELLVTPAGLAQRDEAGKVEKVAVDKQPLAKGFIDAFLLVFTGDDKALGADFELYFDGDESAWTMGFVPKKAPLSKFIATMVVTGKQGAFETLEVREVNGDRTTTRFSKVVTDKELSPDEEKRWFGWR
ncbi:MAG TPA: outer membrane lipoprotein carrier protein LolA [Planctomycetota bacterium]|nr:outer membrane lipoprotein carrier protein LolA [Planctomycetota bacterium]